MKIITLYDGTLQSKTALRYGINKAQGNNNELIVLDIFQKNLFLDYDAGPRAEDMARAEARRRSKEARDIIQEMGMNTSIRVVSREGDPEDEFLSLASTESADLLLAPPRYKAVIQSAPCPVHLIPGTILVPVDNSESLMGDLENIANEATMTGSQVMLLGVVPVHLYGSEEKAELELVRNKTAEVVKKLRQAISSRNIEVNDMIRSGYPDEEILKAAVDLSASLIMLPAGGKTPSELTKAAAMLLEEPLKIKMPLYLMNPAEA